MGRVAAGSFRGGKWRGKQGETEGTVGTRGEQEAGPWSMWGKMDTGHHREGREKQRV